MLCFGKCDLWRTWSMLVWVTSRNSSIKGLYCFFKVRKLIVVEEKTLLESGSIIELDRLKKKHWTHFLMSLTHIFKFLSLKWRVIYEILVIIFSFAKVSKQLKKKVIMTYLYMGVTHKSSSQNMIIIWKESS